MTWVDRLKEARRINTYRLALFLLHRHWKTNGNTIALSNVAIAEAGVSSREKWRALIELERPGLIVIERRRRKSPLIRVIAS
jgi:hypothetical protein